MRSIYIYDDEDEDVPNNVAHVKVDPLVDNVPMRAFQHCQKLVEVSFHPGFKRLEKQAFQHCVSLLDVELPPPTMKIGIRCFDGCHKLVTADLSACRVWVLMTQCFRNCMSLEFVHMPQTLEVIARDAFRGCQSLREVSLEHTQLRILGKRALSNCRSLQKVKIPLCTEQVGRWAFAGCTSLTEAKVPVSLSLNQEDVFKNCPRLQSITSYRVQHGSDVAGPLSMEPGRLRRALRAAHGNVQSVTEDAVPRPSVPAREEVSNFTQALDDAKQENVVLSQRLKDVCEKLERYESQWSTIVDQLKRSTMEDPNTHQNEQEQALQAKEIELETYKDIVEKQRKAIRAMELQFLQVPKSTECASAEHRDGTSVKQAGGSITQVPFRAMLDPEMRLADFVKMQREHPPESAKLPSSDGGYDAASLEPKREWEARKPVPFIIYQDTFSVDTVDILITQPSQGSDDWQDVANC